MFTEEMKKRLMTVDPAQIGHYLMGGFMLPRIKPVQEHFKIAGPAYTVRALARDNDAIYYAMLHAPKGSVIVIDRGGDNTFACAGEIVVTVAKRAGMEALVIDGPATDSQAIKRLDFPVFCTGMSPVTTNPTGDSGIVDVSISCGGAVVNPGDIIFGDADGVIVVPPDDLDRLIGLAEKENEAEVGMKKMIEDECKVPWDVDGLYLKGLRKK